MRHRNLGPHLISAGGALVFVVELYRHWRYGNDLDLVVLLVGLFFVWWGGFQSDRKAAIEGGGFVVDSLVKLGGVFRFTNAKAGGNRAEDKSDIPTVVIPASAAPTHDPSTAIGANVPGEGD